MAITAHQGKFQRVTKLLKVLLMKDLQFFPLVSSLKSRGGEATFLCLHTHHCYIISHKLFLTGGDFSFFLFKRMKLIEGHMKRNADTFLAGKSTYLLFCLLNTAQAMRSHLI